MYVFWNLRPNFLTISFELLNDIEHRSRLYRSFRVMLKTPRGIGRRLNKSNSSMYSFPINDIFRRDNNFSRDNQDMIITEIIIT